MKASDALTPKLRFPEFEGEWKSVPVGDFFDLADRAEKAASFEKEKLLTVRLHANGVTKNEKTTLTGGASYFQRRAGQFIFSKIDLLNGAFGVVPAELDGFASSSDVPAFSFNTKHAPAFFLSWLKSSYQRLEIERTGTSSTLKRVSPEAFLKVAISAPTKAEQQKIAECLSTLDELIDAASQKLDALKAHKKGLMQQLFPREGETLPRLRFPEFQDAPEWEQKILGGLSTIVRGGSPRPIDGYLTKLPDGLNWLKIGDVDKESKFVTQTEERVRPEALSKTREVFPGDLILSNSMSFGRPYILKIRTCIHDGWIAVTCLSKLIDRDFLYYAIGAPSSQSFFNDQAAGGGVKNLNADIIKSLAIAHPTVAEQQRIASCLSSLDDLIAAQSDQLEALKTHKKGLMQQLFPSPVEAEG
ncbi:type I restriction enzyme, S subunit [Solimonas aquatica]|uniref:Type I restriction enzyme, S subunit n=1 Tax=Solimonas aquatica TaxID=489703 RepID=A0A1H9M1N5_9GAMM|nr:restriction endonuclease subunit S [Solimonas aquatica]SER17385.1 type I restriction enzyme, S subunit [Solimonas aquatica]